jgi:hypothetical protein
MRAVDSLRRSKGDFMAERLTPEERAAKLVAAARAYADAQGFEDACPDVGDIAQAIREAVAAREAELGQIISDLREDLAGGMTLDPGVLHALGWVRLSDLFPSVVPLGRALVSILANLGPKKKGP